MAEQEIQNKPEQQNAKYTQGYSSHTISTHLRRTAEKDAAFLLEHIKPTDSILDAGCGPGAITISLSRYAPEGRTIGVDVSSEVLVKAHELASSAELPSTGPGSVSFQQADILEPLPFPDNTFDVIYASQVFGHLRGLERPLKALKELRRVLKEGGVLATRDGLWPQFYPKRFQLDTLWTQRQRTAYKQNRDDAEEDTAPLMPMFLRQSGFGSIGDMVKIATSGWTVASREQRMFLAKRAQGQLAEGDEYRQSWIDVGVTEEQIQETLKAVMAWAECEDAWFASLQCEILAWK